jgi:tRNA (mo5U34)-methyltransferase
MRNNSEAAANTEPENRPSSDRLSTDEFPFDGFTENRVYTKYIEQLTDKDLTALNSLLPWKCFTVDSKGRRFGNRAWPGKRETPHLVPDPRIAQLDARYDLRDKHVLELGCFEGVHTAGLCSFGARVTAIDSRIENVVKTIVRCAMFGYSPTVYVCDLEESEDRARLPQIEILHHVGVLYHLTDPVGHLQALIPLVKQNIMLDTHYAEDRDAIDAYEHEGRVFRYQRHREAGRAEVFSGMLDHAKWLRLDDILDLLGELGFGDVDVVSRQLMRNGPRVLMYAKRTHLEQ